MDEEQTRRRDQRAATADLGCMYVGYAIFTKVSIIGRTWYNLIAIVLERSSSVKGKSFWT